MTMSMAGKITRRIGLATTEAWWGLKTSPSTFSDISSAHPACLQLDRTDSRARNLPGDQIRQVATVHNEPFQGRLFNVVQLPVNPDDLSYLNSQFKSMPPLSCKKTTPDVDKKSTLFHTKRLC
jgi:hypothetical protein